MLAVIGKQAWERVGELRRDDTKSTSEKVKAGGVSAVEGTFTIGAVVGGVALAKRLPLGIGEAIGKVVSNRKFNFVGLADLAFNTFGEAILGKKVNDAMGGYVFGNVVSLGQAIVYPLVALKTGDTRNMDAWAAAARSGRKGVFMKALVDAGDFYAQRGFHPIDTAVDVFRSREHLPEVLKDSFADDSQAVTDWAKERFGAAKAFLAKP